MSQDKPISERTKEKGAELADKASDTAQRMKPESEKTYAEKAREKVADTWESTKEKANEAWDATKQKAEDASKQMGIKDDPTYNPSYHDKPLSEKAQEFGATTSDKVSDTAQRMKPESEKSLFEKTREKAADTWEATKGKAYELGEKIGLTSHEETGYHEKPLSEHTGYHEKPLSEQTKEFGATTADKVSDTAQRMKPESEKSYAEKAREKTADTWEATKGKAKELGEKMGVTTSDPIDKPRE